VLRYAYLGPAGTFTEAALRQLAAPDVATYLPQVEVVAAIEAERRGAADFAVVAIENSVGGAVSAVRDTLATGEPLVIVRELLVSVSFTLARRARTFREAVRTVAHRPLEPRRSSV
jgi:prephenate dehydratase